MKIYELKTDRDPFMEVWLGTKKHETRKNDRNFGNGDILHLRETYYSGKEMEGGRPLKYTGRDILAKVDHIQKGYGIKRGWRVLSITKLAQSRDAQLATG